MNRISASPTVLRIVAFAIAAMMMLVIAFGSADMSEAKKKKKRNHGRFDCDAAQVNVGNLNFIQYNNVAAVCFKQ